MSKYTTELRYICEMNSGFPVSEMSNHTPDEIISASRTKIFNFDYPIFDETHRPELETKILKHYYTREISAETFNLWRLWLNEKMNLIMPTYNDLYRGVKKFDNVSLLYNVDIRGTRDREDDFQNTNNSTTTGGKETEFESSVSGTTSNSGTTKTKFSDTPQGTVSNVDNNTYLTEYTNVSTSDSGSSSTDTDSTTTETNNTTTESEGTNSGTEKTVYTEYGYRGDKLMFQLLSEYRKNILNIDQMIVEELSDLFIMLW